MTPFVMLAAGCGFGLLLVLRGAFPAPAHLGTAIRRLDRVGPSVAERREQALARDRRSALMRRVGGAVAGRLGARVEADLAVMDRPPERFAIEKLATALALGAIAVGFSLALQLSGVGLGGAFTFAMAMCALAAGFVTPDLTLRAHATDRRSAFRHALSSYLDLVNVLLAGGAGLETSLQAAAEAGDGWSFQTLRSALVRAKTVRVSPWQSLLELGQRLQIAELVEIAASVQLAGEQGARVKISLAAKAAALRAHQMAQIEADAHAATERMGLPTVLMFLGFMVLLGYPAMEQIVGAL